MTDPGESGNKDHGSGWPTGYAWPLLLVLFGFMGGLVLWLAVNSLCKWRFGKRITGEQ